jgi:hypothetical protein
VTVTPRLAELDAQIEMHRDLNHQRAADYEARLLSLTIEAAALRIVEALNAQTEQLVNPGRSAGGAP